MDLSTNTPEFWERDEGVIAGTAPADTDLFVSPLTGKSRENAPILTMPVSGDFLLRAEVEVEFASTFDAGGLLLWYDSDSWAKLCFEYSPQGEPMIVSVVHEGTCDDCNGAVIDTNRVHLRVGRKGPACVFHYSTDGVLWHMARVFRLTGTPTRTGFLVQSPTGQGCRATFRGVDYRPVTVEDIRSGE